VEKLSILMVDDQPAKLLTYEAMLAQMGEVLIKAHTAREALACLLKDDIAVVLMDVNMPEVDGFELAELIRQHPRCDKTAIIFVSAVHLSDLDRVRGYETGAVDYVSVPVVPEVLRAKIGVFLDLYRKTAQLERLNRTLEERVSARTLELRQSVAQLQESESRLRQQGEALAEADRRKNEFLAMLAHELRNPLQPIRNAVELLRLPGTPPAQREWGREVIDRQVSQLVHLVDDLLDASRISSGKMALRKDRVDIARIIATAVEANRPVTVQKGQQVVVDVPPLLAAVDGDAVRLTQVFINLLNNAAKFTRPGGCLTIDAQDAGDEVVVRVADDGVGIAAADLDHVFEMFYQGKAGAEAGCGGLGLGLALVRQLVELHGGAVSARSAGVGQGSEFTVRLPAMPRTAPAVRAPAGSAATLTGVTGRRILVVDDNRDAAESLALMLRMSGNEVDTVFDGADAIAAVARFRPDVVLMDIGMPRLDGYQTARAIRDRDRGGDVVLIAITGWGSDGDRRLSRDAGFDRHLVKPVVPAELFTLLASLDPAPPG
jgi:signal transduction histidine kinase